MKPYAPLALCAGVVGVATLAAGVVTKRPVPAPALQTVQPVALAPRPPLAPPRLTVTDEAGKAAAIAIARADINVQVSGPLAETTLTLTFRNDTNRVMEGELNFPLPEGATVSGYALDIAGKLRDAVPVEKDEARVIFEKEVRKGVDPGLVEQTVGNNFKTRIYPLPAHGTRTCRIRYVSDLETDRQNLVYRVPLRWNETIPSSTVRVEVAPGETVKPNAPGMQPRLEFGDRANLLQFTSQNGRFVAERTFDNARFDADLSIQLPDAARATLVTCEPFTRASMTTPESYFVVRDVPANITASGTRRMSRLGIVWDASLSRAHADLDRERRVLEQIIRTARPQTVDVIVLRNRPEPVKTLQVNGNPAVLLDYLKSVPCDGGTNLASLRLPASKPDAWLVFTDGIDTLGGHLPPLPADTAPLYTIASDARANHAYLHLLSERAGGAYLNLNRLAEVEAAQAVTSPVYSLLSADVVRGTVDNVFTPGTRAARDGVIVAGVLRSDSAQLALHYGIAGQVQETRMVTISRGSKNDADAGRLVGQFWAQRKADSYSALPDQNREWLLGLGRDFGVVTPRTSLLVLENVNQYVEHKVSPPRTDPELLAAYASQQGKVDGQERKYQTDKMPILLALWQERVRWWNTQFPDKLPPRKPADVHYRGVNGVQDTRLGVATGGASALTRVLSANAPVAPSPAEPAAQQQARYRSGGRLGREAPGAAPASTRTQALSDGAAYYAAEAGETTSLFAKSKKEMKVSDADGTTAATIEIKPWTPNAPYTQALKAAGATGGYAVYLRERPQYETSPAFYLDCAEFLLGAGRTDEGIRVLTSLLDLNLDDPGLMRIVAQRLNSLAVKNPECRDLALVLFQKLILLRPEEPQSFRDLALAYADRGDAVAKTDARQAARDYGEALKQLHKVVMRRWDRFEGIEEIALVEAGRVAAHAKTLPASAGTVTNPFDPRLIQNLPCDMRIVMSWDTDSSDMDLWVTEPTGEKCFYSYNRTPIGGHLSRDFTQGYGPEEYVIRRAPRGTYTIQTNYYGDRMQKLTGGTTLQAWVITNWGRPSESRQPLTLRLTKADSVVAVGTVKR